MKKEYVTPAIAVEHYEVTQTVANCTVKIGLNNSQCVINDADATNQMKAVAEAFGYFAVCEITVENGEESGDGICYHTNANAAFNS